MNVHEKFLQAIHEKRIISVGVDSLEKGFINRKCIPFDYGPSNKFKDGYDRYHFLDLSSPQGAHNLSILPSQLKEIELLDERFDPKDYIHWKPNWIIPREWGKYS